MKKVKKLLCLALVCCMFSACMCTAVFADNTAEVRSWLSSTYLNPDKPILENNPWSVEGKMTSTSSWNEYPATTTPSGNDVELFPVMQDGNQPTTGYVVTGDYNGHWGSHAANMAVNGKYMIPGAQWIDKSNSTTESKIAKVFTAPKDGRIKITAAGVAGSATEGYIITNYFSSSTVTHSDGSGTADISTLSWSVETNGETKWQKTFSDIATKIDYPAYFTGVAFGEFELDVTEGQKIYFSLNPVGWTSARDLMACMWDPFVSYADENGIYEKSNVSFDKVDLIQDSFKSSNYLNPEKQYVNNPWTVEADIKADGDWKSVESFVARKDTKPLFPTMPDGVTPQGGYIANGDIDAGWSAQGLNLAVNGKYMIPGSIYTGNSGDSLKSVTKSKIAKVFTAPKDGLIKVTAAPTIGDGSEGKLVSNPVGTIWRNDGETPETSPDTLSYSIIKSGSTLWKKTGDDFTRGENYHTLDVEDVYVEVKKGEKVYFVFNPRGWTERASMAIMWDPQIDYISESVFGNADYSNGVVTIEAEKFENTFGSNAKLIAAAFSADDILIGASVYEVSNISTISVSGLSEKPASVKLFVWDFGENGEELIPLFGVIEKMVAD